MCRNVESVTPTTRVSECSSGIILSECEMPLRNYILSTYGKQLTVLATKYDRCMEKRAKFKNHVVFSARCKKANVVPPSLQISAPVDTRRGREIAARASRQFLDERLRLANAKLRGIEDELKWCEIGLRRALNDKDFLQIKNLAEEKSQQFFLQVREKQIAKFSRFFDNHRNLSEKVDKKRTDNVTTIDVDKTSWVLNLSKHELTNTESIVLEQGLNFADSPRHVPNNDIIANVEAVLRSCKDKNKAEHTRAKVSSILRAAKRPQQNTSKDERRALKDLKRNDAITLLPADKGNTTVILDTEEYEQKAKELLGKPPFQEVSRNPTTRNEKRVNDGLKRLLNKGSIDKDTFDQLRVSTNGTQPPRFYGTVKVHKPQKPLRPIVSSIGSATYKLSKYVSRILTPYARDTPSFIMNTEHFRELLSEVTIESDEILVSFDVKSLFTSVPVDGAITAIKNTIEADVFFERDNGISVETMLNMVRICLSTTDFQFKNRHYKLTDGLAMGSPLSPAVANIFMSKFERTVLKQTDMKEKPKVWFRYVDDVFSIMRKDVIQKFLHHLNQQHPSIQFTVEIEKDGKLPFLELTVCRKTDGYLMTDAYRKPTHTGRFLHFHSNHPEHVKSAVVTSLLRRLNNINISEEAKCREFERIMAELSANGYPSSFLKRARRTAEKKKDRPEKKNAAAKQEINQFVCIPYAKGTSEAIRRVLAPLGIRTAFRSKNRKWSLMNKAKDKLPADTQPGVVYAIGCGDCERVYVGETARTSKERIKEHRCHTRMGKTELSAIAQHVSDTGHTIHWEARTLAKEQHTIARKVQEALFIHKLDKKTMNQDKGMDLSNLWLDVLDTAQ